MQQKPILLNIAHIDTSSFALKSNLASLKTEVDKLVIDKLSSVPVDLIKLSDVVKIDKVKSTVYDKLDAKVSSTDTSAFVLKTEYDAYKTELENKILDTSELVKKADYNIKITKIEGKIPDVSNLATKTALTAVENEIHDASSLVKKTDYDTKVTDIEEKLSDHNYNKYITPEFNTLAASVFNARLAQAHLVSKTDFDNKVSSLDIKIAANKTKNEFIENKFKKLKTFDSCYFIDKSPFEEDGTQNYLVFQLLNKCFKLIASTGYVSSWKSKGLSAETIRPPSTSDNCLTYAVSYYVTKTRVKFIGSCLKQPTISYTHGNNSKHLHCL